ncbi:hypothetical protein [Halorarum halobium]|uniref:hypothetical protein n=1 Tax=Halorarum halobium TaxID=3075121 RepID=UPI0028A9BB88|nr:hypothetical protein [Halobaculum sp. XH14]
MKSAEDILKKIDEEKAVVIRDSDLPNKYLVEENGVVIRVSQYPDSGEWLRCIYSNLVGSVQERWIDQALNDEWSTFEDVEIISRNEVPDVDGTTCIAKYCQGDSLYTCSMCGEEIEDGMSFAIHAWDEHGVTEDPREIRDPARGQMSIGKRWTV